MERRPYVRAVVVTALVGLFDLVIAAIGYAVVYLLGLGVAACGPDHPCSIGTYSAALFAVPIAAVVIVLGSIAAAVVLTRRDRPIVIAPLTGLGLTILAVVIAALVANAALAG